MHQFGKHTKAHDLVEDLVCFSYSLGEDSNMSIMVKASSSGDMSIMVKASSSGELPGRVLRTLAIMQSQIPSQAHPHQTKNEGVLMTS